MMNTIILGNGMGISFITNILLFIIAFEVEVLICLRSHQNGMYLRPNSHKQSPTLVPYPTMTQMMISLIVRNVSPLFYQGILIWSILKNNLTHNP